MTEIQVDLIQILKDAVLQLLTPRVGRERAISRKDLLMFLMQKGVRFGDEREVRMAIYALRREGNMILSTGGQGGGYFLAASWSELNEYLDREVHSRAMDLLEQERILRAEAERTWGVEQFPLPLEIPAVQEELPVR
jgi:hypothetical protein